MCVQSNPSADCNNKDLASPLASGDTLTVGLPLQQVTDYARVRLANVSVYLSARTAIATAGIYLHSMLHVVAIGFRISLLSSIHQCFLTLAVKPLCS